MDSLLASYGSDDEDEQEEEPQSVGIAPSLPAVSEVPRKPSLFGKLPAPKNSSAVAPSRNSGSLFASLPPPQFESKEDGVKSEELVSPSSAADGAAQKSRSSLFAKLPAPKVEESGTGYGNPNVESSSKSSLFAALPPPKVEFDSSKVKVEIPYGTSGNGNPKVKKQLVAFKPPIDLSILEDDDDDWRPLQKKAKAEPSSTTTSGGGLQSLLPAPKNSLGLGATLGSGPASGGRRAAMEVVARTTAHDVKLKSEPVAVSSRISTASGASGNMKKDEYSSHPQVQYDNSTYAVDESSAFIPQVPYSHESHGWTSTPGAYVSSYASQSSQGSYTPANSGPGNDPVAQVLQAERRRGREEKMAAPNVIEVKQSDLTGGKLREDQLRTTGIAFGPSYQPVSLSKDKPSKIQRRKHQIGSLLHDMKAREMELLDRRSKGNLTKAETQAKYGW